MGAITNKMKKAEGSDSTPWSTDYFLRDHDNKLYLVKPHTDYLKRSFSYCIVVMRNLKTLSNF